MSTVTTPQALRSIGRRSRRRVRHIYAREDARVARELGVQVRMLCGVWGWPAKVESRVRMGLEEATQPGQCKNCAGVMRRLWRERGWAQR